MEKSTQAGVKPGQAIQNDHGRRGAARPQVCNPQSGRLARMAALINDSSRVVAQRKVAATVKGSPLVQAQMEMAELLNADAHQNIPTLRLTNDQPEGITRRNPHETANIGSRMPGSSTSVGIVQRAIIIGMPLDGSFYNNFSPADAHRVLMTRKKVKLNSEELLERLQELDASPKQNYAGWAELEQEVMAKVLTDDEKADLDQLAFEKAVNATDHLRPADIEVDWQYGGNIGEATTRFVKNKSGSGLEIMIDVNEDDDWEVYSQINHRRWLGQRTTMFIHELAYHGNKEAYERVLANTDDPDYDHKTIFLKETRDKYLTGFLHGLLDRDATAVEKKALVEAWYEDVKRHIEGYKDDDAQGEEALEWLEEAKDEMDEITGHDQ